MQKTYRESFNETITMTYNLNALFSLNALLQERRKKLFMRMPFKADVHSCHIPWMQSWW